MDRLNDWIARTVDDGVAASNEANRDRLRNVVWASLAVLIVFVIAGAEGLRVGVPLFVWTSVAVIAATVTGLLILRRTGRYDIAGHLVLATVFAVMIAKIAALGGWGDPLVGVLYTIPIGAAILISLPAGILWGALSLLAIVGFWIADGAGIEMVSVLEPGERVHSLFNRLSIHIVIVAMVGIFILTQRLGESRLRDSKRQVELEANHVEMLHIAAIAANESETLEIALERWLAEVCERMDWPLAHAHELGDNGGKPISYLSPEFAAKKSRLAAEGARLGAEVDLPDDGDAVSFEDLAESENAYRQALAEELGLRSRIAAIVPIGDRRFLFEMFSESEPERDDRLADVLADTGTQLGRCLERERSAIRIHDLAYYDPLTGLPNRRHFREDLVTRSESGDVVVLLVGLDRFKTINEGLGHGAGDALLREIADRLIGAARAATDIHNDSNSAQVFRLGGDEFAFLLDLADPTVAGAIAQRILDRVSRPFSGLAPSNPDIELFATASIGIAVGGHDGNDASTLLSSADAALESAKKAGGNRFSFSSAAMNAANKRRLTLENELRRAVGRGEIAVVYQPLVDAASGAVVAVEALARWTTRTGESVSPGEFIPLAEVSGQIELIGAWVLRTACTQLAEWRREGIDIRMSVNVSIDQLRDPSFVEMVRGVLAANRLVAGDLELEITESRLVQNASAILKTLERLVDSGVCLALDDFGTGYSSLSQLKQLPIDRLKIDRTFISNVASDPGDSALVDAVLGIARDLDLAVVAEGVETEAQRHLLASRGCDELQGYLFAEALAPEHIAAMCQRPSAEPAFKAAAKQTAPELGAPN